MSRRPIGRSPDLLRLRNEGYDLDVIGGYLVIRDVPYVTAAREVQRGVLMMQLDLAGDVATKPRKHVAFWMGEHPCHSDGRKITAIENGSAPRELCEGLRADFTFSAKANYRDYHHKVTTYVGRITGEATRIEPDVTARTFPAIIDEGEESVFKYVDTASSRAGIVAVNEKVAGQRIGIVGLGGTGAYVLDLVAKTAVAEIHLFDGDVFSQHNAFRSPGAATVEQLQAKPQKVHYLADIYSNMRNGIVVHDGYVDEQTVELLDGLDFVFLCLDRGSAKRAVVERLVASGTPFIEIGMGIVLNDGELSGIVRLVTSTHENRDLAGPHISFSDADDEVNEYASNIQIAELNAFNAALAVIGWKRLYGIYGNRRGEYRAGFSIPTGEIVTEGTK